MWPGIDVLDNWIIWSFPPSLRRYVYNVKSRKLVDLTNLYECAVGFHLSDDGTLAAISSGCNQATKGLLRVIALPSRREVLSVKADPDEYLEPVGFVSFP